MNERDLETALLLRDSGELSPAESAELDAALASNPELQAKADEFALIHFAGQWAADESVPPLAETTRERILQSATPPSRILPKLLAFAALVIIGLALWPHLMQPKGYVTPPEVALNPVTTSDDVFIEDSLLTSLETLNQELDDLADINLEEDLLAQDANDWASLLLAMEDSI
jgi:hypothetical protein